ncbi:AMP-binding protein [Mycolicibacterium boenickei]
MLEGCTRWPAEFAERYRREGIWAGQTLGELPAQWSRRYGSRTAIVAEGARCSYEEFDSLCARTASGFDALGVHRNDRVVVQLPNGYEFFVVLFALMRLGAVPVIVPAPYRRAEVAAICRSAEAIAYVVPDTHDGFDLRDQAAALLTEVPGLRHVVVTGEPHGFVGLQTLQSSVWDVDRQLAVADPSDVALLHLSGGTTGTPKLIPRTHDDYLYVANASAELCSFSDDTVYMCALPVSHGFTLSSPGALGCLLRGGTVVASPNPLPRTAFNLVAKERVTVTALVPAVLDMWLSAADKDEPDLDSLRLIQVGGAKLSPKVAAKVQPVLGCAVQQVFGMTEGLLNFTRLEDPEDIVFTTQGRPLSPSDEVRVVDDADVDVPADRPGNLLVRGPYTIRGYYRSPEHNATAFTADGFYRTGDIVRRTSTGHLVVVGRAKDQINRGGEKFAAEEVEQVLLAHPDIQEAAVVAEPDPLFGEHALAFVVIRNGEIGHDELRDFVRCSGVAEAKVPARIEIVEALPRTAVGKINKPALREFAASNRGSEHGLQSNSDREVDHGAPDVGPRGGEELLDRVRVVWQEVLVERGVDVSIDPGQTLFDVGGTSVDVPVIHERIAGIVKSADLSPLDLFVHPTLRDYADYLSSLVEEHFQ